MPAGHIVQHSNQHLSRGKWAGRHQTQPPVFGRITNRGTCKTVILYWTAQGERSRQARTGHVERGALLAALGAAAARVDALHVLELVLPAVRAVLLPRQVVLRLRAAPLELAHPARGQATTACSASRHSTCRAARRGGFAWALCCGVYHRPSQPSRGVYSFRVPNFVKRAKVY